MSNRFSFSSSLWEEGEVGGRTEVVIGLFSDAGGGALGIMTTLGVGGLGSGAADFCLCTMYTFVVATQTNFSRQYLLT